ncbi:MAG: TolC family protein [Niabella sp.]
MCFRFIKFLLPVFLSAASQRLHAQDTLRISLKDADSIFLAKNFQLLASSMNIEAQKAQIIQAKLYPNPVLTTAVNAYDPENKKPFHIGSNNGQAMVQLEQLILLGGKRKSEIEIAQTNTAVAELEFQQLLRQLKFKLHTDLFTAGQQELLLQQYNMQLDLLQTLLVAYEAQAAKGNIPLKDVVRLKGAYLNLNNDRSEIVKNFHEAQSSLQTLLQTSSVIQFQFSEREVEKYIQQKTFDELKSAALQNRPELEISRQNKLLAEQYWQYQKRLAVPDITVTASYDKNSGAFKNEVNTGISVPLPFWNRNQGNIRSAHIKIKEADYSQEAMQAEVLSGLQNAHAVYTQTVSEYQKAKSLYNEDFEITVKGMTENFQKRNVSIIEFIDFFETYNEVITELSRIKIQLITSGEQLNLLTGKDIY